MGQYRQWLHYRHVDRQLQAQREQLTVTIAHLRENISVLNTSSPVTDNRIIQALTLYMKKLSSSPESEGKQSGMHGQQPEMFSQILFEHNGLPDFDNHNGKTSHGTALPKQPTPTYEPLPPIPHRAMDLLPEKNDTLPDEHAPTEPQVALPWWLHRAALAATQSTSLDAQSVRTNRLVQRWLERWGRQEEQAGEQSSNENEQYPPAQQERQSS